MASLKHGREEVCTAGLLWLDRANPGIYPQQPQRFPHKARQRHSLGPHAKHIELHSILVGFFLNTAC